MFLKALQQSSRFVVLVTIFIALAIGNLSRMSPASAQDTGPTAAQPPAVTIELSDYEPPVEGVPGELLYVPGAGGGGTDVIPADVYREPFWEYAPVHGPDEFVACGFSSAKQPQRATLTLPDGAVQRARGNYDARAGCWNYRLDWAPGMLFGVYTLELLYNGGTLSHTWSVDYPYCPSLVTLAGQTPRYWLMGLEPNETLTLHFFQNIPDEMEPAFFPYIATRQVTMDARGSALITLNVPRSARFRARDLMFFGVGGNQQIYLMTDAKLRTTLHNFAGELNPEPVIRANGDAGRKPYYTVLDVFRARNPFTDTRSSEWCYGLIGQFGELVDRAGSSTIPLYRELGDLSRPLADLNAGQVVEILETSGAVTDGRAEPWYRVTTEGNTLTGWVRGPQLLAAIPQYVEGGSARVQSAEVGGSFPILNAPDNGAGEVSRLQDGEAVRLVRSYERSLDAFDVAREFWWYVRAEDGRAGWVLAMSPIPENTRARLFESRASFTNYWRYLSPLPWSLADVSDVVVPEPPPPLPVSITAPSSMADFRKYRSLWYGLEFIDRTTPGVETYDTAAEAGSTRSFSFIWCMPSAAALKDLPQALSVQFLVNDQPVPDRDLLVVDDGACRRWATLLSEWRFGEPVTVEVRYVLSREFTDDSDKQFASGEYVQRIRVVVN